MNLHAAVSGAIGAINPFVPITIQKSAGYTTNPDGTRVPQYQPAATIQGQVQPLSSDNIRFLDSLQIQGVMRKIFVTGVVSTIIRADKAGGDLVSFPDASTATPAIWKAVVVLEQWPDWASVAVVLQNGS